MINGSTEERSLDPSEWQWKQKGSLALQFGKITFIPRSIYGFAESVYQLRVHVFCARDLPKMDKIGEGDPFCRARLGGLEVYAFCVSNLDA